MAAPHVAGLLLIGIKDKNDISLKSVKGDKDGSPDLIAEH